MKRDSAKQLENEGHKQGQNLREDGASRRVGRGKTVPNNWKTKTRPEYWKGRSLRVGRGETVPNNWIMKKRLGEGGTKRTANNCKTKVASEARILSGRRRKTLPKV